MTRDPPQIETLPVATLTVLLLTHVLSRHMSRLTKLLLALFSLWCYHARVRVHVHIGGYTHTYPRRAVSPAGGLMHLPRCNCLGVGVSAVLEPLQQRFGLVLIQTTQLGYFDACLVSSKPRPGSTEIEVKYCELWPRTHSNIVNCSLRHSQVRDRK